jgi:hypothetical protein
MLVAAASEVESRAEIQKWPADIGASEFHIFIYGLSKETVIYQ